MTWLAVTLVRLYKATVSPVFEMLFGRACRYTPTCSEYALVALERYGLVKGGTLAIKRIVSCHPGSTKYYDPVPELPKLGPTSVK